MSQSRLHQIVLLEQLAQVTTLPTLATVFLRGRDCDTLEPPQQKPSRPKVIRGSPPIRYWDISRCGKGRGRKTFLAPRSSS
jgi:hypothetical protein